jgi:hypothetical protein
VSRFGELTKEYIRESLEMFRATELAQKEVARFTKCFYRRLTIYDLITMAIDNLMLTGLPETFNCRCVIFPSGHAWAGKHAGRGE